MPAPKEGRWYFETDKGVTLCCHGVKNGHVDLSYHLDTPIAVCPTLEDFDLFFEEAPDAS